MAQRVANITGQKCAFDPDYNFNEDENKTEEKIQSQAKEKKRFYREFSPQHEF